MLHKTRNQIKAIDTQGQHHVVLVESLRRVTRTPHGAVVETGGDRFFLKATRQPLVLDPVTAKLCTEDGRQVFTFNLD